MKRILIVSAVVFAALAGIGFAITVVRPQWVPVWARVGGGDAAKAEDAGLFCKEHGVPEKFCTLCHEELKDKLMLCKEHGNIP